MATIKDVAQAAGVSIATVSNYLNKTKPVSRQTEVRIAEAIEKLQYTPNLVAKSLKSRNYRNIGVILPNLNDSYYVQVFQGIEAACKNSDLYLNLAFSYDIPEVETEAAYQMLQKQVCGLIVVTCQPDKWKFYYENFIKQGRPLILIDRAVENLDTDLIRFDNESILQSVTTHLLQMGYRNMTLMAGRETFSCEEDSRKGFLQAYDSVLGSREGSRVVHIELNKEDAFRKTTGLLKNAPPEVIIATSELTATGIAEALHVLGRSAQDIAVVTLGEEHWNQHTHSFAAFSVERSAIQLGSQAAAMLLSKLKAPYVLESEQRLLPCELRDTLEKLQEQLIPKREPLLAGRPRRVRILMLDTPAVHTICRLLKNFENQTGIIADVVLQGHSGLYRSIMESHESDSLDKQFDVYMYDIQWLSLLASAGVLKELSFALETMDTAAFLPGSMEYFSRYGNGWYGIPLMYAPQMLYYRKNLFQDPQLCAQFEKLYNVPLRPPKTFTEYNTVAKFFTADTDVIPYGMSIPAAYSECLVPELYIRLKAYGSEVVDGKGNAVIQNPNALKAYINLSRAVKLAKPDYRSASDVSIVEDFLQGETAMLISYPSFLTDVSDLRKNNLVGSIGCSHIPGRSPLLGGWGLGISSKSENPNEAFSFLKWACTEQMANYFSMLGCYSAVSSTYTNDELVNLYPWRPLYHGIYPYTSPMLPNMSRGGEVISPNDIDAIICKWLYRMLDEKQEIGDVLAGTQEELEELLGK